MQTYIILLRGINVSGQKIIRMADLRQALEKRGFQGVTTYIQSGNIILRSGADKEAVRQQVYDCLQEDFGFDVPVLVFEPMEWTSILSDLPYEEDDADLKRLYFVFIYDIPAADLISAMEQVSFPNEEFQITSACIYLRCHSGYGKAKCNNNFFEKRLKVRATARNLRTVKTLGQMASEMG